MGERQVRMCQECPFADEDEGNVYCGVELTCRGLRESTTDPMWPMDPPGWCPLRSCSVLVVFSELEEALDA